MGRNMIYSDRIFIELLETVQWDEYHNLESIRGTLDGKLVYAAEADNKAMIVIAPDYLDNICMSCGRVDYALKLSSSVEESKNICAIIRGEIKRLTNKRVVKFERKG